MLVLAAMLLIAGASAFLLPVLTTDREIAQDAEEYATLRTQLVDADEPMLTPVAGVSVLPEGWVIPVAPANASVTAQREVNVDLSACKAANADFIAWMQIPHTTVDYPVVWSDDTDYYLHHTFAGKESYIGTLFSLGKTDYQLPSRNIAIYGHHIRSNDAMMFSPLIAYKEQSFYTDHATVYLDSLYHSGTYTIFAVINMRVGDWEPSTPDFASDADFLRFVNQARAQSLYETGVTVTADDEILTLITCDRTYGGKDGRLVIMAVKQE